MTILKDLIDEHGQAYHSSELGFAIAEELLDPTGPRSLVLSWCDGHATRMTVLFSVPRKVGYVPGLNPRDSWLYVSVEGYGTYGFAIKDEPLAPGYIAEKLGRGRVNVTWELLAELVGSVRGALYRHGA